MKSETRNHCDLREAVLAVSDTLFIMGAFPAPTQTFILREMKEMYIRDARINVIAEERIERDDLEPWLAEVYRRTRYIGRPRRLATAGVYGLTRHPFDVAGHVKWAQSFPHRTLFHRARFLAALVIAMDMAPFVRRSGFRYLHAHFAGFQTEVAMCLSRLTGLPFGGTWHAYDIWKDRNILQEKIALTRVVLTCTENNARYLREIAPRHRDKIHLVHHGLDLESLPKVEPVPDDEQPRWLAVGRLIPKKGFGNLIEAGAILKDRGVPFRISIVGEGEEMRNLKSQVEGLRLGSKVEFLGHLQNQAVLETMRKVRGLVQPSVRDKLGDMDGIPNTMLEAMSMARPVVGSDLSGIPEVVIDGKTGFLVKPGSATEIADAMERLSKDMGLADKLGQNGRRLIEESFDVKHNVDEQLALLLKAARQNREEADAR